MRRKKTDRIKEIFDLVGNAKTTNEIHDVGIKSYVENIQRLIHISLHYLRSEVKNPKINTLMEHMINLLNAKVGAIALGPMDCIHFIASEDMDHCVVIIPLLWNENVEKNFLFEMESLVGVGSKLVDYYNDKLFGQDKESTKRCEAYEVEFLLSEMPEEENLELGIRQKRILEAYPKGLESLEEGLLYRMMETPKASAGKIKA